MKYIWVQDVHDGTPYLRCSTEIDGIDGAGYIVNTGTTWVAGFGQARLSVFAHPSAAIAAVEKHLDTLGMKMASKRLSGKRGRPAWT